MFADEVLERLKQGNERFRRGEHLVDYSEVRRASVAHEPQPSVVMVGCADSRVPIEAVFDVSVGDAWVIRSAGHVLSEAGLASVRFGVEVWRIPLVVVVGHEDCLAVRAAFSNDTPEWMRAITDYIDTDPNHFDGSDVEDNTMQFAAVDAHVAASVAALRTYLGGVQLPVGVAPIVTGCTYRPVTGEARWLP